MEKEKEKEEEGGGGGEGEGGREEERHRKVLSFFWPQQSLRPGSPHTRVRVFSSTFWPKPGTERGRTIKGDPPIPEADLSFFFYLVSQEPEVKISLVIFQTLNNFKKTCQVKKLEFTLTPILNDSVGLTLVHSGVHRWRMKQPMVWSSFPSPIYGWISGRL